MSMRILVVDDEEISRQMTVERLIKEGYEAEAHASPFSALPALEREYWDVVLADVRMPVMDGLRLLKEVRVHSPGTAVILMTAYGSIAAAVDAMRAGATDFLSKPIAFEDLRVRLERLAENRELRRELAAYRRWLGPVASCSGLVGNSPAMRQVFEKIEKYADKQAQVLITGETGTGKEQVARALHARGSRAKRPFVVAHCASLPHELAASELFGHEAGAFTGAVRQRRGRVELARGGTLFLDDVDDVSLDLQVKLLRLLEKGEFERVGGEQTLAADVRFISATKQDLKGLVAQGRFREDLYYRLNVLPIALSPLHERREDIPLLAHHFIETKSRAEDRPPPELSGKAQECLLAYAWPGNVRELLHVIEHALANARHQTIEPADLPEHLQTPVKDLPYTLSLDGADQVDLDSLVKKFEMDVIKWALRRTRGNLAQAARMLGVKRPTLHYKTKQQKM